MESENGLSVWACFRLGLLLFGIGFGVGFLFVWGVFFGRLLLLLRVRIVSFLFKAESC